MGRFILVALLTACNVSWAGDLAPIVNANDLMAFDQPQIHSPIPIHSPIDDGTVFAPSSCELGESLICPGWWVTTDLIFWQPHLRSLDYAATEDGVSLAIGAGQTHRTEIDRDTAFRIELGHMTKVGWGAYVSYTSFDSSGSDSATRPPGIGQLFSTLGHPGGPEEADTASAESSLDYNSFDLGGRTRLVDREYQVADVFGGFRWAHVNHKHFATFNGRDYVNGTISDSMELDAFGLFIGGECQWRLADGWSIFGRASSAALYGRVSDTRLETNQNGSEQLVDFRDVYGEPKFNFDTQIGLAKTLGHLQVRVGYDMNIWTGIGDRIRFSDDIEEATFATSSGDLLLEGMMVQGIVTW